MIALRPKPTPPGVAAEGGGEEQRTEPETPDVLPVPGLSSRLLDSRLVARLSREHEAILRLRPRHCTCADARARQLHRGQLCSVYVPGRRVCFADLHDGLRRSCGQDPIRGNVSLPEVPSTPRAVSAEYGLFLS